MAERQQQTDHEAETSLADDLRAAMDAAELGGMGEELEQALGGAGEDEDEDVGPRVEPEGDDKKADNAAGGKPEDAAGEDAPDRVRAGSPAAPEHWSGEDKTFFAGLPGDDVRARVLEWRKGIERGADAKFEAAAEARREVAELERLFQPLAGELQATGGSRLDVVRALLGAELKLRQDPLGGLAQLVEGYGRSVAGTDQAQQLIRHLATALKVGDGAPPGGQAARQDPMTARVTALEAELAHERGVRESAARHQRQELVRRSEDAIETFAAAAGSDGQPAHPHFEQVRPLMGAMMQAAVAAGQPLTLQEAYQQAVWAQPELRDGLIRAHAQADARLAAERDQASLARARQATTPRTASAPVEEPEDNLPVRELLARELDRSERRRV